MDVMSDLFLSIEYVRRGMMEHHPRFMLAAASSNSGKTLITCGILTALMKRGLDVSSFKCGPDYIDPMFHSKVIGTKSRNLDTFFTGPDMTRHLFCRSASRISVIEGVMGFYDGNGSQLSGSSYELSETLEAPVILILNCKGMANTSVALAKGLKEFRKNHVVGIILNNMSKSIYPTVKEMIEKEVGIRVIGHVPKLSEEMTLSSRHLGLVLPDEIPELKRNLDSLASLLEEHIDIDALIEIADSAEDLEHVVPDIPRIDGKVRIGLADDESFCFTYADNVGLLEDMGAEIVRFSPMRDKCLPKDLDGIILSGGYPELHTKILEDNENMRSDIRRAIGSGMPCIAECGGFMYLNRRMGDPDGNVSDMVGALDGESKKTDRLVRFGYITLTANRDNLLLKKGESIRGHEFHYWDCTENGEGCTATKNSGKSYECVVTSDRMFAGYPHLYYHSNIDVPYRFLTACKRYREEKN